MTKEEFEKGYAKRSGLTLEKLHKLGGHAIPCNCDYPHCNKWQMSFSTSKAKQMKYVLYNYDTGEVVMSTVYSNYKIAAAEADRWNNVTVLKIEESSEF